MHASRNGRSRLVPLRVLHERVRADLLAQIVLVPGVPVDRADHAERIARSRQEDRDRPGLDQGALVQGLVVVAVEEHQVPAPQHRVRDHLVGGARAVQDEVGLVGAEHLRGVALRLRGGALVDQQIAEVHVGVAQVVAKDALAEVLEEELAGGRLAVELAALVARAGEGDVGLAVVGHEPAEERRQQLLPVLDEAGDDLLGIEGGRLLAEIDVAVDLAESADDGHVGDAVRIRERPERRAKADGANRTRQLARLLEALAVDQRDVGADRGVLGDVALEAVGHLDLEVLRGDMVEQLLGLRVGARRRSRRP